jgi:hypothetical protein
MGRPWRRNTPATPPGTARAYQDATKVMHLLALRLRLCPEARVPRTERRGGETIGRPWKLSSGLAYRP